MSLLSLPFLALPQLVGGAWSEHLEIEGWHGTSLEYYGNRCVGLGDLDGDGADDIAVGLPNLGLVELRSGATGALLLTVTHTDPSSNFGCGLDRYPDLDGDGRPELLVGASRATTIGLGFGEVHLLSPVTGATWLQVDTSARNNSFGSRVVALPDLDGDGVADFAASAPDAGRNSNPACGVLVVCSGATGAVLQEIEGTVGSPHHFGFGDPLLASGDLDGDGWADLVAAGPDKSAAGISGAGYLLAVSPVDGRVLWQADGSALQESFGSALVAIPDGDGDGVDDLLVGVPGAAGAAGVVGELRFLSGASGATFDRWTWSVRGEGFGWSLAAPGDLDGDGHDEILLGFPSADLAGLAAVGRVQVHQLQSRELLQTIHGRSAHESFGRVLHAAGDLDGDGRPDGLAHSPLTPELPFAGSGRLTGFGYKPCLGADRASLSAAAGGTVSFQLEFPTGERGRRYAILASAHGSGPTLWNGLEVPLTRDFLTAWSLKTPELPWFPGLRGLLDFRGDAAAEAHLPPGALAGYVGRKVHLCALSYTPPDSLRIASVSVALEVLP